MRERDKDGEMGMRYGGVLIFELVERVRVGKRKKKGWTNGEGKKGWRESSMIVYTCSTKHFQNNL